MARTARTDTAVLALPETCRTWLGTDAADRSCAVHEQTIAVDLRWWNTALSESGAPGGPLQIDNTQSEQVLLSRRQAFTAAADLSTSQAVWRLLWLSMAWGTGSRRRLVHRRMRTVAAEPHRYVEVLAKAADCSRTDPGTACALLYPDNRTRIPFLGPAFFTKFLYFAGAGNPDHPSLILDSRVATALHHAGWTSLRSGGRWPADTYQRYTELLARWATEQSASTGRTITGDVLERWLFDHGS